MITETEKIEKSEMETDKKYPQLKSHCHKLSSEFFVKQ